MPRRGSRRWRKKQRGREERVIRKLWRRIKGKHDRWLRVVHVEVIHEWPDGMQLGVLVDGYLGES